MMVPKDWLSASWLAAAVCLAAGLVQAQECNDHIPPSTPDARFVDRGDGTVTDLHTGLMWKQCSEGTWSNTQPCDSGVALVFTWQQALQRAADVDEGTAGENLGYHDWRLPNHKELASLVELKCVRPAINTRFFPETPPSGWFSSSSVFADSDGYVWGVRFDTGRDFATSRSLSRPYLRLVRGGL